MADVDRPNASLAAEDAGMNRNPRLAFNADEADCCTCVGTCAGRNDGICRCLPTPAEALRSLARLNQAVWEVSQFKSSDEIRDFVGGVLREIESDEP